MRYLVFAAMLLPLLLIVAIAAGPVGPILLLAVAAFALVWVLANALLALVLSAVGLLERHLSRRVVG